MLVKNLIDKTVLIRDINRTLKDLRENDLSGQYGVGVKSALEQLKTHIEKMPIYTYHG